MVHNIVTVCLRQKELAWKNLWQLFLMNVSSFDNVSPLGDERTIPSGAVLYCYMALWTEWTVASMLYAV